MPPRNQDAANAFAGIRGRARPESHFDVSSVFVILEGQGRGLGVISPCPNVEPPLNVKIKCTMMLPIIRAMYMHHLFQQQCVLF